MKEGFPPQEEAPNILAGFEQAAEVRNRTSEVEAAQEPTVLEQEEVSLGRRVAEALRERGAKAAQVVTMLTALGLSAAMARADTAPTGGTEGQKEVPVAPTKRMNKDYGMPITGGDKKLSKAAQPQKKETNQETPRESLRDMFIRSTGIDMVAMAERNGFKLEMQVPNGDGTYIFDLAMLHYVSGTEKDADASRLVIRIQKQNFKFSADLIGTGKMRDAFGEGITDETKGGFDAFSRVHETINSISSPGDRLSSILTYAARNAQSEVGEWSFIFGSMYRDEYREAVSEITDGGKKPFPAELTAVRDQIEKIFQESPVAAYGDDSTFLASAADLAAAKGMLKMHAGETKEANDAAGAALERVRVARARLLGADLATLTPEAAAARLSEFKEIRKTEFKIIDEAREVVLVDKIATAVSTGQVSGRVLLAEWGVAHDFKDEVLANNATPGRPKLGLIGATPMSMPAEHQNTSTHR